MVITDFHTSFSQFTVHRFYIFTGGAVNDTVCRIMVRHKLQHILQFILRLHYFKG